MPKFRAFILIFYDCVPICAKIKRVQTLRETLTYGTHVGKTAFFAVTLICIVGHSHFGAKTDKKHLFFKSWLMNLGMEVALNPKRPLF